MTNTPSTQRVKVLTESEIQDKLYGIYLGRHRTSSEKVSYESNAQWTGTEILGSEFNRLRNELMVLREEKELLARELARQQQSGRSFDSTRLHPSSARILQLFGKGFWIVILLGGISYPIGVRFLQASPPAQEASPYTVQVAVYNLESAATVALSSLQQLGYDAFLVESPYRNGKRKYHIYVGRFVTKEEATLERARLTSDPRFADAFVRIQ